MKFSVVIALTVCVLPLASTGLRADRGVGGTLSSRASMREIQGEADPEDEQQCTSMGWMTITYTGGDAGLPKLRFRLTDPRGREIGYDPGTNTGWQKLPVAQAFFHCEEDPDTGDLTECKGHIEICGPISGTYQVELLPTQSGQFSFSAWGTSEITRNGSGYDRTSSRAEWKSEMHEQEPVAVSLQYSRKAGTQIKLTDSNQHFADRVKRGSGGLQNQSLHNLKSAN